MNDRISFSGKNNTASSQKFRKNGISFTSKGGLHNIIWETGEIHSEWQLYQLSPRCLSFFILLFSFLSSSFFYFLLLILYMPPISALSVFFNYFHFQRLEQTLILGILATSAFFPLTVLTGQQRDATQTANETTTLWSFRTQAANYFAASLLFWCQ